jgi:hypothetical protein
VTPTEARKQFTRLVATLTVIRSEWHARTDGLQANFNAERTRTLAALKPKVKGRKPPTLLPDDIHNAMIAPYLIEADWCNVAYEAERYRIEAELHELAPVTPIHPGEPRLYSTHHASSYSSQTAAFSYAKSRAELDADDARTAGLPVEVRPIVEKSPSMISVGKVHVSERAEVWVPVAEQLDLEILRRRPKLSLREQVRLCWKRGANPRVYNPFLPHGYEEREAIDMQGNDLRAAKTLGRPKDVL